MNFLEFITEGKDLIDIGLSLEVDLERWLYKSEKLKKWYLTQFHSPLKIIINPIIQILSLKFIITVHSYLYHHLLLYFGLKGIFID